jgi:hypothetical protein
MTHIVLRARVTVSAMIIELARSLATAEASENTGARLFFLENLRQEAELP